MAKRGKDFNIPANLFDKQFWTTFEATAVNEYRKVIFDKSNPRMSNDKNFPAYSKRGSKWVTMNVREKFKKDAPKKGYSYEEAKKGNMLRRLDSGYANSTAPYVSGDLMRDTKAEADPKTFSVFIGWSSHAYKVDRLREKGRILTSRSEPYPPSAMKKLMPLINKNLKRVMPKGSQTITVKKKK